MKSIRDARIGLVGGRFARHHRDARCRDESPRLDLRSHAGNHVRRRSDEDQPRGGACRGKRGVLGEKTVSRVHGVGPGLPRGVDHTRDREIAFDGRCGPERDGTIRGEHVRGPRIGIRIDGHAFDAQLVAGANDANGNLAAVRDEQATNHKFPRLRVTETQPRSHEDTKHARRQRGFLRGFVSSWQEM